MSKSIILPTQPQRHDLEVFLDVFQKLDHFEAQMFMMRGQGAFRRDTDTLPIPEVQRTLQWIREIVARG